MTGSKEQILELVAAGKLSPAEADALLLAMAQRPRAVWEWVFNPVSRLSTGTALGVSVLLALVGLGLSRVGVRFDGALDVHAVGAPVPPLRALVDLLVAWPGTAAVLWLAARAGSAKGRYVDHLAATGLARAPLVLTGVVVAALLSSGPLPVPTAAEPALTAKVLVLVFATLPLVAWSIALFVMGHRTASGLRGAPLVLSFCVGLVVAEVVSKLLLSLY